MGGNNTKAIYLCETIYPSPDGSSIIPPEKLQKAIQKGEIPPPNNDEEDMDEDEDSKIDAAIQEVWAYYDKKGIGFLNKKQAQQFFKDALELMALRRGVKTKDLLGPGCSLSSALNQSFEKMDASRTGKIDFSAFEEFINENDIDEALAFMTGNTGPITVNTGAVRMVSESEREISEGGGPQASLANVEYRDYPSDDE